jgi:hypothetical protein
MFRGMGFKILRYDDDIRAEFGDNITAYLGGNMTNYTSIKEQHGSMIFKKSKDPSNGWATPFVTGHKYKISFGMTGLDYENSLLMPLRDGKNGTSQFTSFTTGLMSDKQLISESERMEEDGDG